MSEYDGLGKGSKHEWCGQNYLHQNDSGRGGYFSGNNRTVDDIGL
jgi:hypothetical protein